jgi:hypothetical protein
MRSITPKVELIGPGEMARLSCAWIFSEAAPRWQPSFYRPNIESVRPKGARRPRHPERHPREKPHVSTLPGYEEILVISPAAETLSISASEETANASSRLFGQI